MPLTGWLTIVLGTAYLTSCAKPPTPQQSFAVVFLVESDPGIPLGRVGVFVEGKSIGETDLHGLVQTNVFGLPHQRLRVEHDCPDGHEAPSEPKILRLREFGGIDASGSPAMEITLRCRPEKRIAAFIVRAKNGPDLPVLLDGTNVARTNRSGVAHFSASGAAGTDYVVELDTTEHPRLLPRSPTHLFTLADADEIFVVNQSFDLERDHRPRGHRRPKITKIE